MAGSSSGGSRRGALITLWVLAAVYAAGVAAAFSVYVRTATGQRLDEAGFFGREGMEPGLAGDAESLLGTIEITALVGVLAVMVVLAFWRGRLDLAMVVVALVVGSNLTTQALKLGILERPHLVPEFYRLANSYPSGHVTAVASLAMAAVLMSARRVRTLAVALGAALSLIVGLSAVAAGWHRPSDVIGSWLVVGSWAAACGAILLGAGRGGDPRPAARLGTRIETVLWVIGAAAASAFVVASAAWVGLEWSAADGSAAQGWLPFMASLSGMAAAAVLVPTSIAAATRRYPLAPEWLGRA